MRWENVKLGTVVNNLDSRRKPLNDQERSKITVHGLYPYIGANNIMDYVDEYLFDETILCVAEDGGSWGAGQKCSVIYTGKTWVNNHAHVITASDKVDIRYLMYFLNYADLSKHISGSTRGKLTKSSLENIDVPLPPLHIQQKIADTLDKADALRRKDQELLNKYDELTQSIFYDMFGDPGVNNKKWEPIKLSQVYSKEKEGTKCGPFGSALKREEYLSLGIPVWTMDNIKNGHFVPNNCLYISKEKYRTLESYSVTPGDIIISRAGTVGKMCVVETEKQYSIISTNLIRLSLDTNLINPYFFVSLMKYFGSSVGRLKKGADGSFTHMNTGILNNLEFGLPPISLQNKFVSCTKNIQNQSVLINAEVRNNLIKYFTSMYFS
jgi:type I restriction enzyme S subunit